MTNLTVSVTVGWVAEVAVKVRAAEAPRGAVLRTVTTVLIRWVPPGHPPEAWRHPL